MKSAQNRPTTSPNCHWTNDCMDLTASQWLNRKTAHAITDKKKSKTKKKLYIRTLFPHLTRVLVIFKRWPKYFSKHISLHHRLEIKMWWFSRCHPPLSLLMTWNLARPGVWRGRSVDEENSGSKESGQGVGHSADPGVIYESPEEKQKAW